MQCVPRDNIVQEESMQSSIEMTSILLPVLHDKQAVLTERENKDFGKWHARYKADLSGDLF